MGDDSAVAAAGVVHGFPAVLNSFIGRGGPVGEVAGLLERHRLVTVTGPGGTGAGADHVWVIYPHPVPRRQRGRQGVI